MEEAKGLDKYGASLEADVAKVEVDSSAAGVEVPKLDVDSRMFEVDISPPELEIESLDVVFKNLRRGPARADCAQNARSKMRRSGSIVSFREKKDAGKMVCITITCPKTSFNRREKRNECWSTEKAKAYESDSDQ